MEHSVPAQEIDRLSTLPDHVLLEILSFLPTKLAAQTSVLSHRFQHLWETSPSLDLDLRAFRHTDFVGFLNLVNRTLFYRNPPSALFRLCLHLDHYNVDLLPSYISSLVIKASTLGLRHLTVELDPEKLLPLLPLIFSLHSLESLSIRYMFLHPPNLSFPITLTHLKSLYLNVVYMKKSMLTQLIGAMMVLEDLNLQAQSSFAEINLTSGTVRRLILCSRCSTNLRISIPSLEVLELEIKGPSSDLFSELTVFKNCSQWEVPALKKAVIQLEYVSKKNVSDIYKMLETIPHVEELHLDIQQSLDQTYPFDTLGVRRVYPPTFLNLRHIDLNICCHKHNIKALVSLIKHSPVLESLNVVHKPALRNWRSKGGKFWRSKLPRNAEGNYRHAYFKDLHIPENKKQLLNRLMRKKSSKRSKI